MIADGHNARWRLRTQHLVAPHAASAGAVVRGLLGVQAENAGQAAWAVASRTTRPDPADLAGLVDDGDVIRTHVLRPTWHWVAREDVGWLLELTAPRVRPLIARQLDRVHGLSGTALDHASAAVLEAVAASPDQTREQLSDRLREAGIIPDGQRLMLLLALLELDRHVCSGRPSGGTHTYAMFADRVPSPRRLHRQDALAEVALRYFTGHGPATERDLAYWATLTLGDVRRGLAQVRDRLACFEHDGRTYWHAPGQSPPEGPGTPVAHLLQILDEIYRGYQDSRMVIDSAGVVPRGREPALGMALVDGQLVARVKRTLGRSLVFELSPYDGPFPEDRLAAVEEAAARYGAFLGLDAEVRLS